MRKLPVAALSALTAMSVMAFGHRAEAQGPPVPVGVTGSGTPGTVPLWTGAGRTLTDSHIRDNGTGVTVTVPIWVSAGGSAPTVAGTATNGVGAAGLSANNHGVTGTTSGTEWQAGVAGFGVRYGVLGFASATDVGWGVKGISGGTAVGVEGISALGVGIRGQALACDPDCTATTGVAGQFVAGAGGVLLHGLLSRFNGPGGWDETFRVDADGSLSIGGNAFKPGGGSWSTLSDRRVKTSIEPITGALERLLKLRGVSYEYVNPSAFGEAPGPHLGMVAQEVERVFPSWVDVGADGYERLTFRGFEAMAVEALRELQDEVAAKSSEAAARIVSLEEQNAELRRAVEVLSEAVRTFQGAAAARDQR